MDISRPSFAERHYRALAAAALALAAFNLTFRLGREFVTEWDESLYANSAWEALHDGSWIGTTFLGHLDYYNAKPPLMVWLVAAAFKVFGPSLWSLRIVSAACAWLTVLVLQQWTRRVFGHLEALFVAVVLSTTFGFLYVHSGRSAATDAPFTLVMLLTAVVLSRSATRPTQHVWLGPLLAAAFLLRGMAALMPLIMIAMVLVSSRRRVAIDRWALLAACLLFVVPVTAWAWARYDVDGWEFLQRLFMRDFVTRSLTPIEEHGGGLFYYLNILQKHHYDWLIAAATALVLFPSQWNLGLSGPDAGQTRRVLLAWTIATLGVPMLMRTKLAWYLNPFYPLFAIGVGVLLARAFSGVSRLRHSDVRRRVLVTVCVLMLGVAEGKLLWYSFDKRDLGRSTQAIVLAERRQLRGHRVYLENPTRADHFVTTAVIGARSEAIATQVEFLEDSAEGDFLLSQIPCRGPDLELVRSSVMSYLCRRHHTEQLVTADPSSP